MHDMTLWLILVHTLVIVTAVVSHGKLRVEPVPVRILPHRTRLGQRRPVSKAML